MAALVVGLLLLAGGAAFAVTQAAGNGGGYSSPEAAVQALFDALADEDVIGVLGVLPDGERRAIQDPLQDISAELIRLGVLDETFRLDGIAGVDLDFRDLQLEVEELGAGRSVVRVLGGTADVVVTPDELPIGSAILSFIEELTGEPVEIEPVNESSDTSPDDDIALVTIRDGGGWRVSIGYTAAELARVSAGMLPPDPADAVVPRGADSPEAAVEELVRAGVAFDARRVIELLPPGEMSALHDYAPLFLADLESEIEAGLEPPTIDRLDLDLAADGSGSEARVVLRSFAAEWSDEYGDDYAVSFDGRCYEFTDSWSDESMCLDELRAEMPFELPDSVAEIGVTTVRIDGLWYVSPTRTVLNMVADGLGALPDDALDGLAEAWEELFDGAFAFGPAAMFSPVGPLLGPVGEWEDWSDEEWAEWESEWSDDGWDDGDDRWPDSAGPGDLLVTPTFVGLVDELRAQGFTDDEAFCIADSIYAAGFPDDVLLALELGADDVPGFDADIFEQISATVEDCLAMQSPPDG